MLIEGIQQVAMKRDESLSPSLFTFRSRQLRAGPSNPYAAAAAGALACSEFFRRVFQRSGFERDTSVSLLDFSGSTGSNLELPARDVGEVIFVGLGGVANAAIWALARHLGLRGKFWLVDHEDLTLPNLQRYLRGTFSDVSTSKVDLAERALRANGLTTERCRVALEQFAESRGGIDLPTICISVDKRGSRRAEQALLPKLAVNGWTDENSLGASLACFLAGCGLSGLPLSSPWTRALRYRAGGHRPGVTKMVEEYRDHRRQQPSIRYKGRTLKAATVNRELECLTCVLDLPVHRQ